MPRDHARQWRRATVTYLFYSNVCDEGQNPVGGVLYLQRLVGIRMFSLLFSKTNQNRPFEPPPFSDLPAATCATNAVPDSRSGRRAARLRAAVAASNRSISIPTSAVRGGEPAAGETYPQPACSINHLFSGSFLHVRFLRQARQVTNF